MLNQFTIIRQILQTAGFNRMQLSLTVATVVLAILSFVFAALPAGAQTRDEKSARAEKAFAEAGKLFYQENAESNRAALTKLEEARRIYHEISDQKMEAYCFVWLGRVNNALGEKQKALDFYNHSFPLFKSAGDKAGTALAFNNIGTVYSSLGSKQKALDSYNQALTIQRELADNDAEMMILSNIAGVYEDLGERQKAIDYYQQSLSLQKQVGDQEGEASTLNIIGELYRGLGEKQKALDFFKRAQSLFRLIGDKKNEEMAQANVEAISSELKENKNL
jgi:tetratricopeptide (TPR) repeat protein